jgi:ATP-dependent DNA helicase RecG
LLFSRFPTNIMETKCAIRIFQYTGTIESFQEVPNLIGTPKTNDGPINKLIKDAHDYTLTLLRSGIEIRSGFVTKYQLPERSVKEAITNAVIHRDYHIKRDIEISIFEDRIEVLSPGLFPYNITKSNIGYVRADGYRNDLLVKHLREFPEQPNLDRNEGVRAMRNEMRAQNLYDPIYFTYPLHEDSVKVVLLNEKRPNEWEKVRGYLLEKRYINNAKAREITGVSQRDKMTQLFSKWVKQGLLIKIVPKPGYVKNTKYKLTDVEDLRDKNG